jgi:hypothetical protein
MEKTEKHNQFSDFFSFHSNDYYNSTAHVARDGFQLPQPNSYFVIDGQTMLGSNSPTCYSTRYRYIYNAVYSI